MLCINWIVSFLLCLVLASSESNILFSYYRVNSLEKYWVSYTSPHTVVGFSIAFSLFNHTDILPIGYAFLCPSFWHMDFIHKFCHFILTLPLIWNNCWPWHDIVLNIFLIHSSTNASSKLYDTYHQTAAVAAFAMVSLLQCLLAAVPDVHPDACMWHCSLLRIINHACYGIHLINSVMAIINSSCPYL